MDIPAKCRGFLLGCLYRQGIWVRSVTASWLNEWGLTGPLANPPLATRIPIKLAYTYIYAIDMAYVSPPCANESSKAFRRRLYSTLHTMAVAARSAREVRIRTLQPNTNLHSAWITEEMKSIWFTVIHDILPTNVRLSKIRLPDTNCCTHCGRFNTLQLRLTECNEGAVICRWTRACLAAILRAEPKHIPAE
jgi:hypothetical protein